MAVTIVNQPSYPNVSHTNLIYEITSDKANQPQFQYVMDVKLGAALLARIKQYPNPQGKAVFDPAKIFNDYLEYPTSVLTQFNVQGFGTSDRTFNVFFGEQYAANFTSPVTLYSGAGTQVGDPAVAGVNARVFPGTVDPNNGISFNWLDLHSSPTWLTNYPSNSGTTEGVNIENYHPLSVTDYAVLGQYGGGQANLYLRNAAGGSLASVNFGVVDSLTYLPIGPKNLLARGISQTILDQTAYSYVTLGSSSNRYYYRWTENCHYDRTNFLFINKYGAWDNFGITLPVSRDTNIRRDEIKRPFVNYSNDGRYNLQRRGLDYFNVDFQDRYSVSTDWLNQDQAAWLTELIESPKVFVQANGSELIPVVITNSSYTSFTNKKSQKTFEFILEYQYANSRRSTQ